MSVIPFWCALNVQMADYKQVVLSAYFNVKKSLSLCYHF